METDRLLHSKKTNRLYLLILCGIGLLINIFGVKLALGLNLPLYLDVVGSALAAALGGFIPGIIVGFLTNLINGINDYATTYYSSIAVLIEAVKGGGPGARIEKPLIIYESEGVYSAEIREDYGF